MRCAAHWHKVDQATQADAGDEVGVQPGDRVLHGRQRCHLDAALHGLRHRIGLLEDFLLHVVVVPALQQERREGRGASGLEAGMEGHAGERHAWRWSERHGLLSNTGLGQGSAGSAEVKRRG